MEGWNWMELQRMESVKIQEERKSKRFKKKWSYERCKEENGRKGQMMMQKMGVTEDTRKNDSRKQEKKIMQNKGVSEDAGKRNNGRKVQKIIQKKRVTEDPRKKKKHRKRKKKKTTQTMESYKVK